MRTEIQICGKLLSEKHGGEWPKPLVSAYDRAIFDVDRHSSRRAAACLSTIHYDLRFLFEADPSEPLVFSSESKDLAWVPLEQRGGSNSEESIARMVRKTQLH